MTRAKIHWSCESSTDIKALPVYRAVSFLFERYVNLPLYTILRNMFPIFWNGRDGDLANVWHESIWQCRYLTRRFLFEQRARPDSCNVNRVNDTWISLDERTTVRVSFSVIRVPLHPRRGKCHHDRHRKRIIVDRHQTLIRDTRKGRSLLVKGVRTPMQSSVGAPASSLSPWARAGYRYKSIPRRPSDT